MVNSIDIFKNVVFQLSERYIGMMLISREQFNMNNDFNVLKLIKLHFLVIAINSENDDYLLSKNEFWAMPYGPVETNVYNYIKNNKDFIEFELSNEKTILKSEKPDIELDIELKISEALELLLNLEPRLLLTDAGTLVDLTHKWNCWRKNYSLARAKNSYSSIIPNEDILSDIKIVNLDLV